MSGPVGVAVVGHGRTATALLDAARGIVGDALAGVVALDAFEGATGGDVLQTRVCRAIEQVDQGGGVVVMLDLLGASPCQCAEQGGKGHGVLLLAGLNLGMLLKLAALDRSRMSAEAIAEACADSGRRAVASRTIDTTQPQDPTAADKEASH